MSVDIITNYYNDEICMLLNRTDISVTGCPEKNCCPQIGIDTNTTFNICNEGILVECIDNIVEGQEKAKPFIISFIACFLITFLYLFYSCIKKLVCHKETEKVYLVKNTDDNEESSV